MASWAIFGNVGSKMERNGAIRSAKMSHQRPPKREEPGGGGGKSTGLGPTKPQRFEVYKAPFFQDTKLRSTFL